MVKNSACHWKKPWSPALLYDILFETHQPGNKKQTKKRIRLGMQEMWVQSLGWEDPLQYETAPHSSILAWEIPWTEEAGGLQSMGPQLNSHK